MLFFFCWTVRLAILANLKSGLERTPFCRTFFLLWIGDRFSLEFDVSFLFLVFLNFEHPGSNRHFLLIRHLNFRRLVGRELLGFKHWLEHREVVRDLAFKETALWKDSHNRSYLDNWLTKRKSRKINRFSSHDASSEHNLCFTLSQVVQEDLMIFHFCFLLLVFKYDILDWLRKLVNVKIRSNHIDSFSVFRNHFLKFKGKHSGDHKFQVKSEWKVKGL